MLSYRDNLAKIGITPGTGPVSYRGFVSRPRDEAGVGSLRDAIKSMSAPHGAIGDNWLDTDWRSMPIEGGAIDFTGKQGEVTWTEQCQGVAIDAENGLWFYTSNGPRNVSPWKSASKCLVVFRAGSEAKDANILCRLDFSTFVPYLDHIGQLTFYQPDGCLYVSHFTGNAAQVIKLKYHPEMASFELLGIISLEQPTSPTDGATGRAEFQAINPWDGMIYTCLSFGTIYEFFIHYREDTPNGHKAGECVRNPDGSLRTLKLKNWNMAGVQGGCFSPNGHFYVSTNVHPPDVDIQAIFYCSPLNGYIFGYIPVNADLENNDQELEGICYADYTWQGWTDLPGKAIYAVVLCNQDAALDNVLLFTYYSITPTTKDTV
jgi:hypothetical protein